MREEESVLSFAPFRVSASLLGLQYNFFPLALLDNLVSMYKHTGFIVPLRHNFTELRNALASTLTATHFYMSNGEQYGVK